MQKTALALASDPAATAQLYNVSGAALDPLDPTTSFVTAAQILFYSIWGTNDLMATAGGMPYDNRLTYYQGSWDDAALNAGVERVQSDGRARAYMRRFYQTTGELQRPLVTLHNTLDPQVPFQHEVIYGGLAAQAGSSQYLTVIPVPGYGHCNFTPQQIAGAFALLVQQASLQAGTVGSKAETIPDATGRRAQWGPPSNFYCLTSLENTCHPPGRHFLT